MKKALCVFLFACLLLGCFTAPALAEKGGVQTITTAVPCTVTLTVGTHGSVTVNGTSYRGRAVFPAAWGEGLTLAFTPDSGYGLSAVRFGGTDVTALVKDGRYTATLTEDLTVTVDFARQALPENVVRTGDDSCLWLWLLLTLGSGAAAAVLLAQSRKRRSGTTPGGR